MTNSSPSSSKSGSFLGDNLLITGGKFLQDNSHTTNNITVAKGGYERLQKEVAAPAFHNSAQRVDPPKCHPHTREAVLKRIIDWILLQDDREAWIMWLNGAAGAGKSAIAQSIAELCVKQGIFLASFFFFRTDPTRNHIRPLVATLCYQVALHFPASLMFIVQAIDRDPLIFEKSVELQLELLVIDPLRQIGRLFASSGSSHFSTFLILIDGLDECDNRDVQIDLIRTLSKISAERDIALRFLVASRPETHLKMAFNSRECTKILTRLALDHRYSPDKDIRLFLTHKFAVIRDTHPLKHLLDPTWPAPSLIDAIIEKSSGQFIYAAVVMNFVSSPRGHPGHRLEVCRGLRPVRSATPFAQLDALYRHIFCQIQDLEDTQPVLAKVVYDDSNQISEIESSLGLAKGSVESFLSDLVSIISCKGDHIKVLHASLPDFLCDPERSEKFYLDPRIWYSYLMVSWFRFIPPESHDPERMIRFLQGTNPTPELRIELLNFSPSTSTRFKGRHFYELVSKIKALDFDDGGELYNRIFFRVGRHMKASRHSEYPAFLQEHSPKSPAILDKLEPGLIATTLNKWLSSGKIKEKKAQRRTESRRS